VITGVPTTVPLLADIATEPAFVEGRYDTGYLVAQADRLPSLRGSQAAQLVSARP
jgi:acetyl/propionyl-CoA carboxylase alpha subunit